MSLVADGKSAIRAMLDDPGRFSALKAGDWAPVAVRLAKKQVNAARQDRSDLLAIREAIGEDVFEKTLDDLSAYHAKLLARRLDKGAPEAVLKTQASAIAHVRRVLGGEARPEAEAPAAPQRSEERPANRYLGRKAFRTGR